MKSAFLDQVQRYAQTHSVDETRALIEASLRLGDKSVIYIEHVFGRTHWRHRSWSAHHTPQIACIHAAVEYVLAYDLGLTSSHDGARARSFLNYYCCKEARNDADAL